MKTLEELSAIRDRMRNEIAIREGADKTTIVVGMGTCGIAAGARPVLNAFVEEVSRSGLTSTVAVMQSGCMGNCENEPIVEITKAGEKVTYVNMTAEKALNVMEKHIKGGEPVAEYMLGQN